MDVAPTPVDLPVAWAERVFDGYRPYPVFLQWASPETGGSPCWCISVWCEPGGERKKGVPHVEHRGRMVGLDGAGNALVVRETRALCLVPVECLRVLEA